MSRPPKYLSPARRTARVVVWLIFGFVLFLRFVVLKQEPPRRAFEFTPGRVQQGPRFRRPPTRVEPPLAPIPADLLRVHIEIAPRDVNTLRRYFWNGWRGQQPMKRPEVIVTVREGGVVYTNVALHEKGAAGSFREFDDKPAFTLNFTKHAPGQRFHGYSKLSLNNSVQDPSYLCEALCRELFNQAGVPAPKADFATVLVNERDLGLYVLVEGYNKDFLRRYFKNVHGNLYDGGFCQDITASLQVNSGQHPEDRSDLRALAAASTEPEPDRRWARLRQVLDTDRFITMLALESLTCHWDGYALNQNNYRVFHDLETDRMIFMPHGMDQMFDFPAGRFPPEASIQPNARGLVARAVLSTPEGGRQFLERLQALHSTLFLPERLEQRVHELSERIRPTLAAYDPALAEWHDRAVASLCDRISRRFRSVAEQLSRPREPLNFEDSGSVHLREWQFAPGPLQSEISSEDGRPALHVAAVKRGGTGKWQTRVLLSTGRYRFEGRAKVSPSGAGSRVGLRISGYRPAMRIVRPASEWIPLSYTFTVDNFLSEVVLVCEATTPRGEAWFDLDSLRLVKE